MTTSHDRVGDDDTLPDEASVAAFLERDPEFFTRHPELTERLRIPHECGDAVSLIHYQVDLLRQERRRMKGRLDELLQVARDNDRLADRLHHLTLELMDSQTLDSVLDTLKDGLREQFQSDLVAIRLVADTSTPPEHPDLVHLDDPALAPFAEFFSEAQPRLGQPPEDQVEFLFGGAATDVASSALVPVSDNHRVMGIVAVGSFEPERFHPGQGTVFLRQLGQLAGRALRPHLPSA